MNLSKSLSFVILFIIIFTSASCQPATPASSNLVEVAPAAAPQAEPIKPAPPVEEQAEAAMLDQVEAPVPQQNNTVYNTGQDNAQSPDSTDMNRKIIKNAELQLLVEDTDVTIDRITQITADVGGYIISSKSWFKDEIGGNYKYSTLTLGIPVDDFERALRRLRETSIQVLNEVTTGEDVSQEYVDLQSKLDSLQATRARITGFLSDAKTVEEALQINDQLSQVEQQINETLGRMNYLAGRASFSTISVTINPKIREVTPTPTSTSTITPTPMPTYTPTPWNPGNTLSKAGNRLGESYRSLVETLIWFFVYILPVLAPWVILALLIFWFIRRRKKQPKEK